MAGQRQIFLDQALRRGTHGHEADLVAFALYAQVHDALAVLDIAHAQPAELLPT